MSDRFVFDSSPLSAFARAGGLDLLARRYAGRAIWTVEVRVEIERGLGAHPELWAVLDAEWLGEPVRLTDPAELHEIERIRWALGGRPFQPLQHLGEASTMVLARRKGWVAVLDDRDARRLAGALNIRFTGTLGIIRASTREGLLDPKEGWDLVEVMKAQGFRVPAEVDPDWFG